MTKEKVRIGHPGRTELLKYAVLVVIAVYVAALMIFTSGSTKAFVEVEKSVEAVVDTDALQKADAQGLKRYYGLNSADYDGVMLYTSVSSMSAQEVLLIRTKTDDQVQAVKQAVEQRLENRKNDFAGYAPEQEKLLEQAQISVRGKYIFFASSPDAEKYKQAFSESL